MARSLNQHQIIGNLTRDPEVRTLDSGVSVANFSVATNNTYTNRDGEKVEDVQFHRIVAWGKLAEIVEQYLRKGDRVFLQGPVEHRQWEDKDGNTRYTTETKALELTMLGSSGTDNGGGQSQRQQSQTRQNDNFTPDDDLPF